MDKLFRTAFFRSPMLPGIMAFVALGFIATDLFIFNQTRQIHKQLESDLGRLETIEKLNERIGSLASVSTDSWHDQVQSIGQEMNQLEGMLTGAEAELIPSLRQVVLDADSLNQAAMRAKDGSEAEKRNRAVLNLVLSRSNRISSDVVRDIRKKRIDTSTADLSSRWAVIQSLLLFACIFAVILAFVLVRNRRLLTENERKTELLEIAKNDLEATNKELRETMLSKEEKEVMIKEIHHRVKNNLQIVKSLIRFQMYTVDDSDINEKFNECVNRVSAMALVHERTYLSKDLANINVNEYLDQLIKDLIYSYSVNMPVEQDIDIQVDTLTVDTLVPLGLLINEVISNAFKHAFKGRESGKITVHIHGEEETGLIVRIGDNGIGLPSQDKWTNHESLGMDLIHTLTTQLDGEVELLEGEGTMYRVSTRSADAGIQVRA